MSHQTLLLKAHLPSEVLRYEHWYELIQCTSCFRQIMHSGSVSFQTNCMLSRVPFFHDPMDYSPPGFSVHGILLARILEWVAISFSGELPDPEIEHMSPARLSCNAGRLFTTEQPTGRVVYKAIYANYSMDRFLNTKDMSRHLWY